MTSQGTYRMCRGCNIYVAWSRIFSELLQKLHQPRCGVRGIGFHRCHPYSSNKRLSYPTHIPTWQQPSQQQLIQQANSQSGAPISEFFDVV